MATSIDASSSRSETRSLTKNARPACPSTWRNKCYAQLKSLIARGRHGPADETVPESDPRPKHVHLKYKLDLADHGRTWRVLPVSSVVAALSVGARACRGVGPDGPTRPRLSPSPVGHAKSV